MNIIKHRGTPSEAILPDGSKIIRHNKLAVIEAGRKPRYVMCAPYDNHFIYEHDQLNVSRYMCTCGSMAVMVGYNAYKADSSPTLSGELLVCYNHATTGRHANGDT